MFSLANSASISLVFIYEDIFPFVIRYFLLVTYTLDFVLILLREIRFWPSLTEIWFEPNLETLDWFGHMLVLCFFVVE